MTLEQILAANLSDLMQKNPDLDTIAKLHKRSGVGTGTIDRVKKGEVSTKLDTVEKLAAALGVSVVQLLAEHQAAASSQPTPTESIPFADSLDPLARNADERELLTMFRHANDIEGEMFKIAADNVRDRLRGAGSDKGKTPGMTHS